MRSLKTRLDRLECESAQRLVSTQCANCRDWTFVCWATVDPDGAETWETERPQECSTCGWQAHLVIFHIVDDWRNVTGPSRGR